MILRLLGKAQPNFAFSCVGDGPSASNAAPQFAQKLRAEPVVLPHWVQEFPTARAGAFGCETPAGAARSSSGWRRVFSWPLIAASARFSSFSLNPRESSA